MRLFNLIAAVLCLLAVSPGARSQQPTSIPVETILAERQPITRTTDFVGRVEAIERVEVRARVTGFLQKIAFKEGDLVKQGQVLYEIEPDSFQAAVLQARGALFQAQAKYSNASVQRARAEELVKTSATSRAELDRQAAAEKSAQGEVITADANLKTATINLDYTKITSPINGEIGRTRVTVGNVVGPDTGQLTTIVSVNPMYVTFPVSQREFLKIQPDTDRRKRQSEFGVRIRFSDGSFYNEPGQINFVDVAVDRATDTVTVRATIPNPQARLIDGQLVRVLVSTEKPVEKVLIPQAALIADQKGVYVFTVVDGKAEVQRVKPGGESGSSMIIEDGLKGGEQVIVQGMESLRPGMPVLASPAPPPADRS
jgi:membrane fusion protein, multidrug efflux system